MLYNTFDKKKMNFNPTLFSVKVPPNGDIPVKSINEQIQKQKQAIIKVILV